MVVDLAFPEALDGRQVKVFVSGRPNFAEFTSIARAYDLEVAHEFTLTMLDGSPGYRCWSWPDQSFAVFVRADGQVTISGVFVGDLADFDRLVDVLRSVSDAYAADTDDEDGARWPAVDHG